MMDFRKSCRIQAPFRNILLSDHEESLPWFTLKEFEISQIDNSFYVEMPQVSLKSN